MRVLPRWLAPVFPTPSSPSRFQRATAPAELEHSRSPRRALAHCEGFAPAASRRTWAHVSEPISGLPLSWPVGVIGLSGHYPDNNLIPHSPILGRLRTPFKNRGLPALYSYGVLAPVSRDYPPPEGRLTVYYGAGRRGLAPHDSHGLVGPG